ncbi:MAG: AAA family ATPase, partial [Terriglobia bacterium]
MIQPSDHNPSPLAMGESVARLAVTRLMLTNFRSYSSIDIETAARPVVLAGPNGAGKTNLLDAISLLSPGRGLRGARLGDHVRKGPVVQSDALWAVAATVRRGETDYDIGTGLTIGPNGGERRHVRLNGVEAKGSADLGDMVQMLWLTPA